MKMYNTKTIELKDGQTGYDAVEDYVYRYMERNGYMDVIVSIAISYNGRDYDLCNEIACPGDYCATIEFLSDWWEGQKFIKLLGIQAVSELKITGGIYEE